jgi:flavin-binding protein dodecin
MAALAGGSAFTAMGSGAKTEYLAKGSRAMAESVYKVIELVGTSSDSWEKAAAAAVARAADSLRDLRIAEVSQLDLQIEDGKVTAYRAKVKVSFKYEGGQ